MLPEPQDLPGQRDRREEREQAAKQDRREQPDQPVMQDRADRQEPRVLPDQAALPGQPEERDLKDQRERLVQRE